MVSDKLLRRIKSSASCVFDRSIASRSLDSLTRLRNFFKPAIDKKNLIFSSLFLKSFKSCQISQVLLNCGINMPLTK